MDTGVATDKTNPFDPVPGGDDYDDKINSGNALFKIIDRPKHRGPEDEIHITFTSTRRDSEDLTQKVLMKVHL